MVVFWAIRYRYWPLHSINILAMVVFYRPCRCLRDCNLGHLITPTRKIRYSLDENGLTEGGKLHKYDEFRAFGILKEGSHFSIILIPKKRFAMQVKVYFPSDSGEAIVDMLGARLPMEEVKLDFLDKLVNFLRI